MNDMVRDDKVERLDGESDEVARRIVMSRETWDECVRRGARCLGARPRERALPGAHPPGELQRHGRALDRAPASTSHGGAVRTQEAEAWPMSAHPDSASFPDRKGAFEVANACNACGKQMERGAVMVCHECAGKSFIHPTPLKIGETIRWKKDSDDPVLEKSKPMSRTDRRMARDFAQWKKQTEREAPGVFAAVDPETVRTIFENAYAMGEQSADNEAAQARRDGR
jgi:hypothetical protein